MAIQHTITKLLNEFKTSTPVGQDHWHTESIISEEILQKVFTCLEGITDLIKASSVAFWIANRFVKKSIIFVYRVVQKSWDSASSRLSEN